MHSKVFCERKVTEVVKTVKILSSGPESSTVEARGPWLQDHRSVSREVRN